MDKLVQVTDGQVVVSSRSVAENFGKEHKHVLQSVRLALVAKFLLHRIERLNVLDFPFECLLAREAHHEKRETVAVH